MQSIGGIPMVAQKRGEVAVGQPRLGVQGLEHRAHAQERRFEHQAMEARRPGPGRRGPRRRRGGVGGGGEGDAGAEALAPEHEARARARRVGAGGVGEDGGGVEHEPRLGGPAGRGPVAAVGQREEGVARRWGGQQLQDRGERGEARGEGGAVSGLG